MKFKIEKQLKYGKDSDVPNGYHYALMLETKTANRDVWYEWLGNFKSGTAAKDFAAKYVVEVEAPVKFEIKEKK